MAVPCVVAMRSLHELGPGQGLELAVRMPDQEGLLSASMIFEGQSRQCWRRCTPSEPRYGGRSRPGSS